MAAKKGKTGRGLLISFEGGEGSGKTTQARLLHEHLVGRGGEAVLTREPGGTPFGERLRKVLLDPSSAGMDPLAELLLYLAARREHLARVIEPALRSGAAVIVDRFADATMAYQGYGRGLDRRLVARLNRMVCGPLEPDLTFLILLADEDEGLRRARARQGRTAAGALEGRFEDESRAFHRRVGEGYRRIARRHPGRVKIIDGGDAVEAVHRRIVALLEGLMGRTRP